MSINIQTILVGTDFSEASQPATTYAFRLARALRARLYLMHVVPEEDLRLITSINQYLQSFITPITLTDIFYTEADKRLTQLMEDAQATDVVQERLVVTGQPADAILSWAVAKQVRLIIRGTHGRRGVQHYGECRGTCAAWSPVCGGGCPCQASISYRLETGEARGWTTHPEMAYKLLL